MTSIQLTPAERRRLAQAIQQIDSGKPAADWAGLWRPGLARASLERTCQRLCAKGVFKPYADGGWEVTNAGRLAHAPSGS